MPVLSLQKPFTTEEPTLLVENKLAVGAHLLRLVVVNGDGVESDPVDAVIQIVDGGSSVVPPLAPTRVATTTTTRRRATKRRTSQPGDDS